jgi:hypothetical protein
MGGDCPSTGTGGAGGSSGGGGTGGSDGTGGAGGDTTMGSLSTDASTDPGAYGGGGGCGCALSDHARPHQVGLLLMMSLAIGAFARRRQRGGAGRQASCAMRPSFSGRSIR